MVIILMGVSGSGKTTIGKCLARALNAAFYDGDDFHPAVNVAKMARGLALSDADRYPWLDSLRALIAEQLQRPQWTVVACSALKQAYRDRLTNGLDALRFVYLHGSYDLIAQRLQQRQGHFMPATLLQSQFDTLEIPPDAIHVDVAGSPGAIVQRLKAALLSHDH